jgi:hypothetical protein
MRTRLYGGVAGASGQPLPLCRFQDVAVEILYRPDWRSQTGDVRGLPASNYLVVFLQVVPSAQELNVSC